MTIGGEALRISRKDPVRVRQSTNVVLSGGAPLTVDGVTLAQFDRVLVTGQSSGAQNGIYMVSAPGTGANGTWERARDAMASNQVRCGMEVLVIAGTLYQGHRYVLSTQDPITLDTTALEFQRDGSIHDFYKRPAKVATTGDVSNLASGAPSTVDGQSVSAGDRVLVWKQTTLSQNGIYVVDVVGTGSNGQWSRAKDFDESSDLVCGGVCVYVQSGTLNGKCRYTIDAGGSISIGSDSITFVQEYPLVRTDQQATQIIAAATSFTSGTIVWSSAVDMRDHSEISVWFQPTSLGSNTEVSLYAQWSDDGSNIPFDDDNGVQQTDFLLVSGTDGTFQPKDYVAKLTTAGSELVANRMVLLTFPKKGGSFRFGVKGNSATGAFGVKSQRLAR